jgi:hypothetical protein
LPDSFRLSQLVTCHLSPVSFGSGQAKTSIKAKIIF